MYIKAEELWTKAWNETAKDKDLTNARVGGRSTKAFPNREDVDFWQQRGPEWVDSYIQWRKNNSNWKIWVTPQGAPAIELAINPTFAGIPVKMVIDRVFEVDGELVVVDLKTSQQAPLSQLQLGFYRLGLKQVLGVDVKRGTYWMARHGGTESLVDLTSYTDDKLEYLLSNFDKARKAQIFLPNTNNCNRCGLTEHCVFTSKNRKNNEQ